MVVALWCLCVGAVTALNGAVTRLAYRREKNADMLGAATLVLAALLAALYACPAWAVVTG
jgi:hypothetical protein